MKWRGVVRQIPGMNRFLCFVVDQLDRREPACEDREHPTFNSALRCGDGEAYRRNREGRIKVRVGDRVLVLARGRQVEGKVLRVFDPTDYLECFLERHGLPRSRTSRRVRVGWFEYLTPSGMIATARDWDVLEHGGPELDGRVPAEGIEGEEENS